MTYAISNETIQNIKNATQDNFHTESILLLAQAMKDKKRIKILKSIKAIHEAEGFMPCHVSDYRKFVLSNLLDNCQANLADETFKQLKMAF